MLRDQALLGALALGDVAHQGIAEALRALLELVGTDLDLEDGAILAPVAGLEGDRFPGADPLRQPLDGRLVQADIEIARVHPDQFFPAVAQAFAGLAVDVEHGQVIVMQEKASVAWSTNVRKRASLARSSSSARRSSVMSCIMPNMRRGRPASSHVTSPRL